MADTSTMIPSAEQLDAVAINGSPTDLCTITWIVVRKRLSAEPVWLLDPKRGLKNPITLPTLQQYASEQLIHLLDSHAQATVMGSDMAFCVSKEFLESYQEVCREGFPWEDLTPHGMQGGQHWTVFGPFSRLQTLQRHAAAKLLEELAVKIPSELPSDPAELVNGFLPAVERWARCGAMCVDPDFTEGRDYYLEFHQIIAAVLVLMPNEFYRLRLTYDLQVQSDYPDITFEQYARDARIRAENWQTQASLFKRSSTHHRMHRDTVITVSPIIQNNRLLIQGFSLPHGFDVKRASHESFSH
ncbi:MAG: hypothetical protein G8237_10830 [Magnetococcales bacterium]|nr:hypothetical protein [Magnetococcales bacterium]